MIGVSLSFCVTDIAEGRVNINDVEVIVTSTAIEPDGWDDLIERYKRVYWYPTIKDPNLTEKCEAVCRQLLAAGKVEQPKLTLGYGTLVHHGCWVASRDEIKWDKPKRRNEDED